MKKLLILALLFVGCGFFNDNCILYKQLLTNKKYLCYEGVYTKKECMDKIQGSFTYDSYVAESCSEFCKEVCSNFDFGYPCNYCTEY